MIDIKTTRLDRRQALVLGTTYFCGSRSWANDVSSTPLSLIVGYPPGGLADASARYIANELSMALHRPVWVRNTPGANGIRAFNEFVQSDKEHQQLMLLDTSTIIALHRIEQNLKGSAHILPVGIIGKTPFALAAPAQNNIKTISELIKFAKKNPQKINYGSPGEHTVQHLIARLLLEKSAVEGQHIPYQGGAQILADLLTQKLDFAVLSIPLADQYVKNGKLRILAITAEHRSPKLPTVPTLAETYTGLFAYSTAYLFASPQTTISLYRDLTNAWQSLLIREDFRERLNNWSLEKPSADLTKVMKSFSDEQRMAQYSSN
jgi:tripartite-type tricarboxylate transporter receptor subunit TctC